MRLASRISHWLIDMPRDGRLRRVNPLPTDRREWIALAVLAAVTVAYLLTWVVWHRGMLFDPQLQNDDARTALVMFHGSLDDDPVTQSLTYMTPPGMRALYGLLMPVFGLPGAAKVVTCLSVALLISAGVWLGRSMRGGWAAGCALVMLMLQAPYVTMSLGGGLPRTFGFAAAAWWIAGAVARDGRPRVIGVAIAAATYPSMMAMLFGGEVIWTVCRLVMKRVRWRHAASHIGIVGGLCVVLVLPQLWIARGAGRAIRPSDAAAATLLGPDGRVHELPFAPAGDLFAEYVANAYREADSASTWPWLIVAVCLMCQLIGYGRRFAQVGSFVAACVVLYWVARWAAFSLYAPTRFAINGMLTASIMLVVSTLAALPIERHARCAVAAAFLAGLWLTTGGHLQRDRGMTIDYRAKAALFEHVKTLPTDVRIAMHPMDGMGIAFWTGRATMDHYETLQPWRYEQWKIAEARTQDTLRAMYAMHPATLLDYADEYGVTHVLYNVQRYGPRFREAARSFEPLSSYTDSLLANVQHEGLLVFRIPAEVVVFREGAMILVEIEGLKTGR